MLRATHAPLLLTVLGRFFVEEGRGASSEGELVAALDDQLTPSTPKARKTRGSCARPPSTWWTGPVRRRASCAAFIR
ncbi:hypothetical protein [Dietzia natronolimnaea]|uniref:hypothetical protein n=1 Tax=Dietzia natronolimnaea TaxID=161920 RepID=UPI002481EB60|nr:hypothetical protein [Dietzia natronolimnaea]